VIQVLGVLNIKGQKKTKNVKYNRSIYETMGIDDLEKGGKAIQKAIDCDIATFDFVNIY